MGINNYLLSCYRIQDEGTDAPSAAVTEEPDINQVVEMHTVVLFQISITFKHSLALGLSFVPKN